jgi:hypothetical protein
MKIIVAILIFILAAFSVLHAQTTFVHEINLTEIDDIISYTPSGILSCADNGIIVLGEVEYVFGQEGWVGESGYLVKLDAQGNCLWQRAFDPFWNRGFIRIDSDNNNNVYYLCNQDPYGYSLCKTDTHGNSLILGGGNADNFWDIHSAIRLPNNEIIAVGHGQGNVPSGQGWTSYFAFLRISAAGNLLSYRQYPPDINISNNGAYALDVELGNDGLPVALCSIADSCVSLVKFDLDGNILSRTDISSDNASGYPKSLTKSVASGHFFVLSFSNPFYTISEYSDSLFIDSELIDIFSGPFEPWTSFNTILHQNDNLFLQGYIAETDSFGFGNNFYKVVCYNTDFTHSWTWTEQTGQWWGTGPDCLTVTNDNCVIAAAHHAGRLGVAKIRFDGFVPNLDYSTNPDIVHLQVHPNPCITSTAISFDVQEKTYCEINIYNLKGQLVRHLYSGVKTPGSYEFTWFADDENGNKLSSGVYFCRYVADGRNVVKKIVLLH